ncbi:MAG: M20 family metallo-hydrolase [Ginsengibacter sp.]
MIKNYSQRASTIDQRINELALLSGDEQSVTRIFGTKFFIECSNKIADWMRQAGLETCIDNIGNIRGKLKSKNPNAKTFVIGSHFDSVNHAGKYEGVLGILSGLDMMENIIQKNISLPFHLELISFSEHEGVRFNYSYLGSHVVAGTFQNKLLEIKDDEGNTLSDVLQSLNYQPEKLEDDAIRSENLLGYFEIHIDQGNVLSEKDISVGVVSSIRGQKRIEIKFAGKAGHAGTVAMPLRKDALAGAAKFIIAVEKYAVKEKGNLLATIGKVTIPDAASNVIAGTVFCTLDIRSDDPELLSDAYEFIYSECENICDKRNIYFEWKLIQETDPVDCNKKLKRILSNCVVEKKIPLIEMVSGAGHDAAIMSSVTPVAMLFVKCFKNIGENPPEVVEINDIAKALEVSDLFIQQLLSPPEKLFRKKEK